MRSGGERKLIAALGLMPRGPRPNKEINEYAK